MKRLSLILFIMIALAGFAFADPSVKLNGTVKEGGGVTPPGGGDVSLSEGAIKSYLYYDVDGDGTIGVGSTSGLTSLSDGKAEHLLKDSFDLTGTKDDPDTLYLYIFAGANAKSTGATLKITFSCTEGWVMTPESKPAAYKEQNIPLLFRTTTVSEGALTASATDNNASTDTSPSAEIEITAAKNAHELSSKIVSRTEVFWVQGAYYAGDYSATITVTVDPGVQ